MRITTIALLSLCSASLAQSALAQSTNVLSGTLDREAADEHGGLFGHTSKTFDPDKTRAQASQAFQNGDYIAAFNNYLVVCVGSETTHADSCHRAAEIADDADLDEVPKTLRAHLYKRACDSGHQAACSE